MTNQTAVHTLPAPPGPQEELSVQKIRQNPLQFLLDMTQQYGDIIRYRADGWDATLVNHPNYIRHVLQDNYPNYTKEGTPDFMMLRPMLGEGILTSEGESWLRQRRMTQPAFHRKRIEALGGLMTDITLKTLHKWEALAEGGQDFDMVEALTQLTLEIVAKALFGYDVSGAADRFGKAVEVLNECIGYYDPNNMKEVFRRFPGAIATIRQIVNNIIQERRRQDTDTGDCLSLLLTAHDEETDYQMSDSQVSDQIVTLMLAGHETTAKALSWTLYLMSQYPEVETKLYAEVAQVLNGRTATFEDLPNLPYTWMVIQEAMRIYTPIWLVSRIAIQDDTMGGYTIPAKSLVAVSPYTIHRHPAYWERPNDFYPEHFTPEAVAERPSFAYIPFSAGPRVCLGKQFASMEAHLVLATLAQHYRVHLRPNHVVEPEALVTLRPKNGLPMYLEKIK